MVDKLCFASMLVVALILVCLYYRNYLLFKQIEKYKAYLDSLSTKVSAYEDQIKELSLKVQSLQHVVNSTSNDLK